MNPLKNHVKSHVKSPARVRRTATAATAATAVTAAAATGLLAAALAVPAAASASPLPRQVVTGIRPSWAQPSADEGSVAAGTKISAALNGEPEAYAEESLDVEAAHAMAPDADIAYVGADCANDPAPLLDALTRIVDGHLADIVSDSWHLGTEAQVTLDTVTAFQRVFEQGAVEGIGFYFASGDSGDWSAATPDHRPAVQFPASDPWVTSVGGTSLAAGPAGRYEWETGWGTDFAPLTASGKSWTNLPGSFTGGAGGGASTLFAQPSYQRGIVPDALSHPGGASAAVRVMPDIAADADPSTGMLVGLTTPLTPGGTPHYIEGVGGGTSLSTPLIAGIQADAQQAKQGVPIGFANPAIYARYGTTAYHDVTDHPLGGRFVIAAVDAERNPVTGVITSLADTFAADTSLHATPGYDDVTGVGTPTSSYLDSYPCGGTETAPSVGKIQIFYNERKGVTGEARWPGRGCGRPR